jgi:hypothetical protein
MIHHLVKDVCAEGCPVFFLEHKFKIIRFEYVPVPFHDDIIQAFTKDMLLIATYRAIVVGLVDRLFSTFGNRDEQRLAHGRACTGVTH